MRFFHRRPSSPSFVVRRRSSSPSSVVAVVRHPSFHSFVKGTDLWKKSNFRCFSKTRNFSKIQDFWQNECMRFFHHRPSSQSFVVPVVRRRHRPSSPSSVIRHFTLSSKGRTFEKNQIFAVFQKLAIFLKFKIFGKMSAWDFFAVVRRRRRSSSPSLVVVVVAVAVVAVVRHFTLSSKGRTFEKNQIFAVFQKLAIFLKFKIFGKMSARDFFAVVRRRSPSFVVAIVQSSPSSVVRHFTLSSKGRTFEKNQIFAVFQKLAIFLKFKIFGKMSARDFFTVVRRRVRRSPSSRRRPSSPSSVIRHFTLSSKGRTFEKNQIFAVFQNLAIFLKFKIFGKMSARDFFTVVRRRRRSSSPSFVVAIVRRRRRPSSVISLFRQRDGPLKKIKFSLFFKNWQFS